MLDNLNDQPMEAPPAPPQPPIACGKCRTPLRKFWRVGDEYYPCQRCDGQLCESCCEGART